jgi:outer membrane lipoprotein LolB
MRRLELLLLLIILGGCASFYDVEPDTSSTVYTKPSTIESGFNISGRFIIKQPQKNNYGNFTWNRTLESEELDFNTPIGQTVAKITIESGIATLYTKNESYTAESLNEIMEQQLGFVIPMGYLHYWIQGVPLPGIPISEQLSDGFVQLGWKVEYLQWATPNHPQILQCTHDDLVIKLLIEW